jgi:hypothetical protein
MESNISMQKLKEQGLTPAEKFVLDKIKGVKPNEPYENGDVRWSNKDYGWLFTQDFEFGYLYFSWVDIDTPLRRYHGLSSSEIKQLLTKLLYKYTNNGKLIIRVR